ncbi:MAG: hypothetical protein AAF733_08980, partial [Verrucomicrobiota bacterium]
RQEKFLELVRSCLIVRYSRTELYDESNAMQYMLMKMSDAIYASEAIPEEITATEAARVFLAYNFEELRTIPDDQLTATDLPGWCDGWIQEMFAAQKLKERRGVPRKEQSNRDD